MVDTDRGERALPTGTVTFLRTDVEGSMRLVRQLGPVALVVRVQEEAWGPG